MSVFTPITQPEAQAFANRFNLGTITELKGIAAGVENTNYFLSTTAAHYVLTIFETLTPRELAFYMPLKAYLAAHGFPCPLPMAVSDPEPAMGTAYLGTLKGKPAGIVTRLEGPPVLQPTTAHCFAVGALLAQLHATGRSFDRHLANWRGREWREQFARDVAPKLHQHENTLIASENAAQAAIEDRDVYAALPRGIIHGDLFRDNVLWSADGPGVIDFYFACDDALAYDLAITVNDFCTTLEPTLDHHLMKSMIHGYEAVRTLTADEKRLWPMLLRRAALRTWLGRLGYNYFPRESVETTPKDHQFSERLLRLHIDHPSSL